MRYQRDPGVGIWSHLHGVWLSERGHPKEGRAREEEPRREAGGGAPGLRNPASPKSRERRMQREGGGSTSASRGWSSETREGIAVAGFHSPILSAEGVMEPQSRHPQLWQVVSIDLQGWADNSRDQRPEEAIGSQPRSHSKMRMEKSRLWT